MAGVYTFSNKNVSSHAPVRGHPREIAFESVGLFVSSHAPVRGHPAHIFPVLLRSNLFQVMPP